MLNIMCEFDWNLAIQLISALGSIAVAILAIWGDYWRSFILHPVLKIERIENQGEVVADQDSSHEKLFYHFKVVNSKPRIIAKNCRVLLKGISVLNSDNKWHYIPYDTNMIFLWTPSYSNPLYLDLSYEHVFDFGFVILTANEQEFIPGLQRFTLDFKGFIKINQKVIFHMQPISDNYMKAKIQKFQVTCVSRIDLNSRDGLIINEINDK